MKNLLFNSRLVYVGTPGEKLPSFDAPEMQSEGIKADDERVKKAISDAKNEVVKFVNENGLNFSEEYYDDISAELNVDDVYNQLVDKHQFGVKEDVGKVAHAFVDYVNTLRTYHQHVKAGKNLTMRMINDLNQSADALSRTEINLHDPIAGLGLGEDPTTGLSREEGPVNELLAKRETMPATEAQSPAEAVAQTVAENEQSNIPEEVQEEGDKDNYVSTIAYKIIDQTPLTAEEQSKTIQYIADLGGEVESYDLEHNAKVLVRNENGRILVEYYPKIDKEQNITKREFYATVEPTGAEKTA